MPHQRYFTQAVLNDGCHGNTLSRTQRYSVEFGKVHLHRPLCFSNTVVYHGNLAVSLQALVYIYIFLSCNCPLFDN